MECYLKSMCSGVFLMLLTGLSGCSTVSTVAEKSGAALSRLNPFSSASPDADAKQVEAASGNGVALAAAQPSTSGDQVQAMVADNKQCTTFCSLPIPKPR